MAETTSQEALPATKCHENDSLTPGAASSSATNAFEGDDHALSPSTGEANQPKSTQPRLNYIQLELATPSQTTDGSSKEPRFVIHGNAPKTQYVTIVPTGKTEVKSKSLPGSPLSSRRPGQYVNVNLPSIYKNTYENFVVLGAPPPSQEAPSSTSGEVKSPKHDKPLPKEPTTADRSHMPAESVEKSLQQNLQSLDLHIPIKAKADYKSTREGVLSFRKGDTAYLLDKSNEKGWWCVQMSNMVGWVPGDYWLIVRNQSGSNHKKEHVSRQAVPDRSHHGAIRRSSPVIAAADRKARVKEKPGAVKLKRGDVVHPDLQSALENHKPTAGSREGSREASSERLVEPNQGSPQEGLQVEGFVGKMDREHCEGLLTKKGTEVGDFVIRESTRRSGDYVLSVLHTDKVRHFPLTQEPNGIYHLGQDFQSIEELVKFYRESALKTVDNELIYLLRPLKPGNKGFLSLFK